MAEPNVELAPQPTRRKRFLRRLVRTVVAFFVILALTVGGFVLYAWLGNEEAPAGTIATPKVKAQLEDKSNTTNLDPESPVGVSVQSLTTPTAPGSNVLLIAKTRPNATCTITAEYDKVKSQDSGLIQKDADDYGMVQWSWAVGPAVPEGKWPVTVTCTFDEKSGVVVGDLEVKSE